jgi:Fucose permease
MADEMAAQVHPRDRQELLRVQAPRGSSPSRVAHGAAAPPGDLRAIYVLAWLLCAIFYFYQYAVRSAPGVMQPELTAAWGGNYLGGMISAYYVAYALMALVAGLLLDRYGARQTIPLGIAAVGVGCLIFAQGSLAAGMVGFVLQAIGAIFGIHRRVLCRGPLSSGTHARDFPWPHAGPRHGRGGVRDQTRAPGD